MWPQRRHFAFVTDLQGHPVDVDAFHREHARVELRTRDLKEGAGLEHVPSGHFSANAAWLLCAALAHNLIRWSALLGELTPADQLVVVLPSAHPILLRPWSSGQPLRNAHAADAAALAMGGRLRTGTRSAARSATGPDLTPTKRPAHRRRRNRR